MDFLTRSEEKVSTMFKSISLYCEKCGKDVQIQDHAILDLQVLDDWDGLQETLNRYLQHKINNHYETCHKSDSKRIPMLQ